MGVVTGLINLDVSVQYFVDYLSEEGSQGRSPALPTPQAALAFGRGRDVSNYTRKITYGKVDGAQLRPNETQSITMSDLEDMVVKNDDRIIRTFPLTEHDF